QVYQPANSPSVPTCRSGRFKKVDLAMSSTGRRPLSCEQKLLNPIHPQCANAASGPILTFASLCGGEHFELSHQRDNQQKLVSIGAWDWTFALRMLGLQGSERQIRSTSVAVRKSASLPAARSSCGLPNQSHTRSVAC